MRKTIRLSLSDIIMLFGEGAIYALLAILFSVTAGSLAGRFALQAFAGDLWFFEQDFSIAPTLAAMPALIALCAAIPLICYRFAQRDSLVERLRE